MLRSVKGPLAVVAVCGRSRQGKSFILNQIATACGSGAAKHNQGFEVAPTHKPCTKVRRSPTSSGDDLPRGSPRPRARTAPAAHPAVGVWVAPFAIGCTAFEQAHTFGETQTLEARVWSETTGAHRGCGYGASPSHARTPTAASITSCCWTPRASTRTTRRGSTARRFSRSPCCCRRSSCTTRCKAPPRGGSSNTPPAPTRHPASTVFQP